MLPINIFPTASNIALFLNGVHVELAYGLQYKVNSPKIPIYGYNDRKFSKVASGKKIIQGALILQFVFPGYLSAVLARSNTSYNSKLYNYDLGPISKDAGYNLETDMKRYLRDELPPNGTLDEKKTRAEFISSILSNKDPIKKQAMKNALIQHFGKKEDSNKLQSKELNTIVDPLDVIANDSITSGNSIDIYYADPEFSTFFTRFTNVEFTEVSQQASQAGAEGSAEPLYLIYQFISNDMEIKTLSINKTPNK